MFPGVDGVRALRIVANDGRSESNDKKGTGCWRILSVIAAATGLLDALDVGVKTGEPLEEEYFEGF